MQSKFPIWSIIEESGEMVSRTQHDKFFVRSWDTCTPVKRVSYLWMGVTILLISELVVLLLYISFQPWRYTPKHGGVSQVGNGDRHRRRLHQFQPSGLLICFFLFLWLFSFLKQSNFLPSILSLCANLWINRKEGTCSVVATVGSFVNNLSAATIFYFPLCLSALVHFLGNSCCCCFFSFFV